MFRAKFPIQEVRYITVKFNQWYLYGLHKGLDCRTKCFEHPSGIGTPIRAIADGEWKKVDKDKIKGNYVVLTHEDGFESVYGHLSHSTYQKGWKEVKCGDVIGYCGRTGRIKGVHLHLEIWKDGVRVDPMKYIKEGDKLIKWAKEKTLLRVENHGKVNVMADKKLIEVTRENVWEVLTNRAFGINEKDYKDLNNLLK